MKNGLNKFRVGNIRVDSGIGSDRHHLGQRRDVISQGRRGIGM